MFTTLHHRHILIFWTVFLLLCQYCSNNVLFGQQGSQQQFFLDVLSFKGTSDSAQRIDVFSVIPYQSLTFVKQGATYITKYLLVATLRNKDGKEIQSISKERPIAEERMDVASGYTGAFDYDQTIMSAPPGQYTIEVQIYDVMGKRKMSRQRGITTIPFERNTVSLSSLMFSNAIAQNGNRYAITPYLDDDIAPLVGDVFFAFFELYNQIPANDSTDFSYELLDAKNNRTLVGKRVRRFIGSERSQQYIRIDLPGNIAVGNYTLRIMALRPDTTREVVPRDIIAASVRALKIEWKGLGFGTALQGEDLNKAIKQMRYVATVQEINAIQAAPSEEEKQRRFYEYWKKLDPSSGTPRNEAFDEYYSRIEFANRTFRLYNEGWQTDMGMVYVIFGQPASANEQRRIDGRVIVSWYYPSFGREFNFVDSGFSDFRLITPIPVERYRYRR